VLGTRVDGFPETLADGRGLMVDPDDPTATADALEELLSGSRTTDLAGARKWAEGFVIEKVASMYERDYVELCRAVAV